MASNKRYRVDIYVDNFYIDVSAKSEAEAKKKAHARAGKMKLKPKRSWTEVTEIWLNL